MKDELILSIGRQHEEYLHDESRQSGCAEEICFPKAEEDLSTALAGAVVTVQGARTGLDGKAVPHGGRIINMKHMNRLLMHTEQEDGMVVQAEAGISMGELLSAYPGWFFPPAPTELTATLGGVIVTDARGLFADRYGGVDTHVLSVKTLPLANGQNVIYEAAVRLLKKRPSVWGIAFQFASEVEAQRFSCEASKLAAVAVNEYLDAGTVAGIARLQKSAQRLQALPTPEESSVAMVYIELHEDSEDAICASAEELMTLSGNCGCSEKNTWALCGESETQLLRDFRHAAQEAVHAAIDETRASGLDIYAVGADIYIDGEMALLQKECRALNIPYACFGHLCGGRIRLNFMPQDMDALHRAEEYVHTLRIRKKP